MVVAADVATPTPAPGNCDSMSSTPRNSCSHFTKSRPSGVNLQQLYKNQIVFLSTHRNKLRVVNITHFTHSMGHRSPVLGHPTPAFVVLFWYTSAWLVQQLFSINSLKSVIDSGVHWKVSHWKSQIICMGKITGKQKNALCNCLTGFGAVTRTGFCSIPKCSSRPATRCDSSPTCTHQRKNFHATYGTSVILNWTTLTML